MSIWARISIISGLLGLIVANTFLPGWLQGVLLAVFILAGPGAAVCAWLPLPLSLSLLIAPATGPVLVVLYGATTLRTGGWDPFLSLAIASFVTVAAGLARSITEARVLQRGVDPTEVNA